VTRNAVGLAFSGGRDSWACLWLNEHRLADIHVIWVNPGKNYPELLATVERARAMCPNFHEVRTDREGQHAREGLPSDVVPIDWTALGQQISSRKPVMVQSYLGCCFQNISQPLHAKAKELGLSELIRGQRASDAKRGACSDGDVVDGIVYRHPIEAWTTEEVMHFLASKMDLPAHLALRHSSMDCYDCTAYRKDSADRIEYMKRNHPELFAEYETRALKVDAALREAMSW
jgi:3'-phosphoadenosine 5'-phosphosulfate sulfotransferase (PAPS reductase)/FAD synthetase